MTTVKELKKWIELFPDEYVVESIYGDDTLFIIDTEEKPARNTKGRFRIDDITLGHGVRDMMADVIASYAINLDQ